MLRMKVTGMTCGGCASSVQRAVNALDSSAQVKVDLGTGMVEVESDRASAEIAAKIRHLGFGVEELAAQA